MKCPLCTNDDRRDGGRHIVDGKSYANAERCQTEHGTTNPEAACREMFCLACMRTFYLPCAAAEERGAGRGPTWPIVRTPAQRPAGDSQDGE